MTFTPTGQEHEFAFNGSIDMAWQITDRFDPTSSMRTEKLKGCVVQLNEHFTMPDVAALWTKLPTAAQLLQEHNEQ